ncbi:ArnT family glycosyltransferase [Aliivibrio salmonicida]|uniref:ArnT family glycosyltransferase n=1 Tax=Aliivibrio salmonicida TaxID=40269 RepID=UPI00406CFD1E
MSMKRNQLWLLLGFALVIRLISLAAYPLMDTTEARYGEMARLMVETGNWLTPQFDYGIPFWGKPPMFTWMSAYGLMLFGFNEFAVRAPHWLAGVVTLVLIGFMAKRAGFNPLIASVVLATCGIFSISAGAIMTDMALTLTLTVAMMGFYYAWLFHEDRAKARLWGYIGFSGLGLALLAKGPVAIVLMGIAVFPWLVLQHGVSGAFRILWQRFPLISGSILMLLIALPWYIMAEIATPNFLNYFIIGEHFNRFFVSGWEGDLYGSAHDEPKGMIWLFWIQAAAPWSLVLPVLAWFRRDRIKQVNQEKVGLISFFVFWLLSPLFLFTMAGNILPAYVLPGIPALGMLVAIFMTEKDSKWFAGVSMILPVMLLIALLVLNLGKADQKSDRIIFESITQDLPIYYVNKRPFSGQFYSEGKAKEVKERNKITVMSGFYLIGKKQEIELFIDQKTDLCVLILSAPSKRELYHCSVRSLQ